MLDRPATPWSGTGALAEGSGTVDAMAVGARAVPADGWDVGDGMKAWAVAARRASSREQAAGRRSIVEVVV